jgi:hypothetical protein
MKEHPILFSGPMINAILEGRKTQTRRVLNPQPKVIHGLRQWNGHVYAECELLLKNNLGIKCPYGMPADNLWVRETWAYSDPLSTCTGPNDIYFRATATEVENSCCKWRPSIFMIRWASRIQLEITEIYFQRLQEISEGDAKAEGVSLTPCTHPECVATRKQTGKDPCASGSYIGAFAVGWDSINGKRAPWASNPWVWVVSFRRVA